MKRFLLVLSLLLALLASCDVQISRVDDTDKPQEATPVDFGAYVHRGVSSKAGMMGDLSSETIKDADAGFGVFGFAGNGGRYHEALKPDFMYNQPVKFQSGAGKWTYSPVKYWPNETGEDAQSAATQRLSFFAYAPYVQVTPATGAVTGDQESGIIGMTHYQATGNPQVQYRTALIPGNDVDLCWGYPFIDAVKPTTGDRLKFEFHHALSQLNVQIDTDIDPASRDAGETRIYVRSVTFNGFTTKGSLDLNNASATPSWYDLSGTARPKREPVTIYDGRVDGSEGVAGAIDAGEKLATLNPAIVQSAPFDLSSVDGVTSDPVNLFRHSHKEAPILVVPLTGTPLSVTIVYDVETADSELIGRLSDGVTHGISTENQITSEVLLANGTPMTLEAGKKYKVHLHLGLSGVKFKADVIGWDDTEYGKGDLPDNKASFDIVLGERSSTRWIADTVSLPSISQNVSIIDKHGSDVTSQASISWSDSDEPTVATVGTDGSIALGGASGVAHIVISATYEGYTKEATYTVNVNEVTGITIAPATANIVVGGTRDLTATVEHTKYGSITTLPKVEWSSNYGKVTVFPSEVDAVKVGLSTVASTLATVAADAEIGHSAVITATVGGIFVPTAVSEVSGTATLTCKDSREVGSITLGATSTTVWIGQGATIPTVTVRDTDGNPLPEAIKTWTSGNEAVATVTSQGDIELHAAGTAVLTVKASYNGASVSAFYTVNVNDVTGIRVSAPSKNIGTGLEREVTAVITHTNNGTIESWPTVGWGSNYAKVTLDPTSEAAHHNGTTTYSVTTAQAAVDAELFNKDVVITASIGTAFASAVVSNSVTLTCKDSRTVKSVSLAPTSITVWKGQQNIPLPTSISVTASDDSDLTGLAKYTWRAKTDIAVFNEDTTAIIAVKGGTATFTLEATYDALATTMATADYTVYVNEVTKISVTPAEVNVDRGSSTTLTAQLTKTEYGDYSSLTDPTISWSSADPSIVSVPDGSTGTSVLVTGMGGGTVNIKAEIPQSYVRYETVYNYATSAVTSVTPSMTAYRGYEISPGILVRNKVGDADATYSLTSGSNPFELYDYYGHDENSGKYYNTWTVLRSELGDDENHNIDSDSNLLPSGWLFPTVGMWDAILHGSPKVTTKVNGTVLTENACALISVKKSDNSYYYGLLIIRDGVDIPSGYLNYVGSSARYSNNRLTMDQFNTLMNVYHCAFVSAAGYRLSNDGSWRDDPNLAYDDEYSSLYSNYYWTSSYMGLSGENIIAHALSFDWNYYPTGAFRNMGAPAFYLPVRLVQPVSDN